MIDRSDELWRPVNLRAKLKAQLGNEIGLIF